VRPAESGEDLPFVEGWGIALAIELLLHGGKAVEEQLADIGEGDGVRTGDALADELLDEIAEEEIDGIGGGEILDAAEKFVGDGFGVGGGAATVSQLEMAEAEAGGRVRDRQATTATIHGGVGAAILGSGPRRDGGAIGRAGGS